MNEKLFFCTAKGFPLPQVIDGNCLWECDNQMYHLMQDHLTYQGKPLEFFIREYEDKKYYAVRYPDDEDKI